MTLIPRSRTIRPRRKLSRALKSPDLAELLLPEDKNNDVLAQALMPEVGRCVISCDHRGASPRTSTCLKLSISIVALVLYFCSSYSIFLEMIRGCFFTAGCYFTRFFLKFDLHFAKEYPVPALVRGILSVILS